MRGGLKWGLVIATILSVALALGKHFMVLTRFFLDYFPYYSKFRSVSSILVVAEIAMPLLGLLGVQAILDGKVEKDKLLRGIKISALVTAGICLLFALFGPSLFSFTSQSEPAIVVNAENWFRKAVIDGRKAMLVGDSLRSAAFIAVAAGLLLLFAKGKLKKAWLVPALGLLIVLDLWPVDRRYFGNGRFVAAADNSAAYAMQDWEKQILQDPGFFRVFIGEGGYFLGLEGGKRFPLAEVRRAVLVPQDAEDGIGDQPFPVGLHKGFVGS